MLKGEDTILQLYGSSNTEFINASQVIFEQLPQLKGIDVNLGCPAQCAQKENYGFFFKDDYISLLSKLKHIYPNKIVSAKIRLCPTLEASINKIQKILDTGLDILTIHCRKEPLANDESQKEQPDYQMLYDVLNIIKPSSQTKIIVNGGLKQFSQSLKQHSDYIHGEMIGVGFMGNPKLCQVEVKSSGKILLHYYLGQNELNMLIEFNKTFLNNSDYNSMQQQLISLYDTTTFDDDQKYMMRVAKGYQLIPALYYCIETFKLPKEAIDIKEKERHLHLLAGRLIRIQDETETVYSQLLTKLNDVLNRFFKNNSQTNDLDNEEVE
ncbi:TRNA_dihydrouridine synthase [Hexamita inflata]|uniref:tRNA dihydrouridine synthase n=1 Tax=Hexamita inflata TaxID=28002 RepID=A0AA86QY54_9EUKA|nr:TRNA dihydrouridine synthase [Hexamita inflata]